MTIWFDLKIAEPVNHGWYLVCRLPGAEPQITVAKFDHHDWDGLSWNDCHFDREGITHWALRPDEPTSLKDTEKT